MDAASPAPPNDAIAVDVVLPALDEVEGVRWLLPRLPSGHRAIVVQSHAMFAEVNPLGAHKGAGLARLAESLGIQQEEVMAIGDQDNDVPMVAWAGLGVAVGNASVACQAAAKVVTADVSEDGAAVAIEQFVLGKAL